MLRLQKEQIAGWMLEYIFLPFYFMKNEAEI